MKHTSLTFSARIPSQDLIASAKAVLSARAYANTIRPIIDQIRRDNLQALEARSTFDQQIIRDPSKAYEMPGDLFEHYIDMNHASYIDAGFIVKRGYCPLLIAEELERNSMRRMVKLSESLVHQMEDMKDFDTDFLYAHPKELKQWQESVLQYLIAFVNKFSDN